jgi:hypothetical protein
MEHESAVPGRHDRGGDNWPHARKPVQLHFVRPIRVDSLVGRQGATATLALVRRLERRFREAL